MKDIQVDLNEKQMVLQTNKYYLSQYFQYKTDYKKAKAEFVADKGIMRITLPVIRDEWLFLLVNLLTLTVFPYFFCLEYDKMKRKFKENTSI